MYKCVRCKLHSLTKYEFFSLQSVIISHRFCYLYRWKFRQSIYHFEFWKFWASDLNLAWNSYSQFLISKYFNSIVISWQNQFILIIFVIQLISNWSLTWLRNRECSVSYPCKTEFTSLCSSNSKTSVVSISSLSWI